NISTETGRNSPFEYSVTVTEQGAKIDTSIPHTMPLRIGPNSISIKYLPMRLLASQAQLVNNNLAIALLGGLASDIVSDTVGPLARPAHYLPADRAGVMHAHQVAVRGLIAGASRTALRPDSPMPVLSGVLGDFMEQLVALADSSRREQDEDYDHLAQNLEQTLLRGAVRVEQSPINYPSFVFQPNGWKRDLPLMNASSMVSELAPVVLYLRHVVQPGDLLIIEEPESHLHPAMQVEFIRQLAAAVQSGVRILITTHSEWVLEELANLVRLSELPEERRDGIDDEDIVLSPDQVGAWFFEPSSEGNGSTVRGIALDTESATFPAGFGLVTEALYNRWSEISTRIEEG
ncbi:MAG: AAA family ATPase, partial [Gemmatimonadetes bacterium]|nr:AAA family ATPase [Gemmatimonadota bacterium]